MVLCAAISLSLISFCRSLSSPVPRRQLFLEGSGAATCAALFLHTQPAWAVRGAAELDLEYYLRDLAGGNRKEGNILPSAPPLLSPPRALKDPILSLLLNDDCSAECLPTKLLTAQIQKRKNVSAGVVEKEIQERVVTLREAASKSFYARAPWKENHVFDQYYFDLTSYALWRTAAELLPSYVDRDEYMRQLGRSIYDQLTKNEVLKEQGNGKLSSTLPLVEEILSLFALCGVCRDYRLGEKLKAGEERYPILDELDDKVLKSGASIDCLISIFEPSTLGASLQLTGEQSRFTPDFVGPTVAAMWEKTANLQCNWESYFVDPEYRPNPKDYFPNEQLFQFSLSQR